MAIGVNSVNVCVKWGLIFFNLLLQCVREWAYTWRAVPIFCTRIVEIKWKPFWWLKNYFTYIKKLKHTSSSGVSSVRHKINTVINSSVLYNSNFYKQKNVLWWNIAGLLCVPGSGYCIYVIKIHVSLCIIFNEPTPRACSSLIHFNASWVLHCFSGHFIWR